MADLTEAMRLDPKNVGGGHVDRAFVYRQTYRNELADNDAHIATEIDPKRVEFRLPKGVRWSDLATMRDRSSSNATRRCGTNDRNSAAYLNRVVCSLSAGQHERKPSRTTPPPSAESVV